MMLKQLNISKISEGSIALMSKDNKRKRVSAVTFADGIEKALDVKNIFNNIHNVLYTLDVVTRVYPYQSTEPDAVATLLGLEALGMNTLANAIKDGFMVLRNFFLKLRDAVVSFFKYMTDINGKVRKQLTRLMNEFNIARSSNSKVSVDNVSVMLIPYESFTSTISLLDTLYTETNAVYKANSSSAIANYCTAIKAYGYKLENNRLVKVDEVPEIERVSKPLAAPDANWGWSISALSQATIQLITATTKAEKLNYLKDKIDNAAKAAGYTIDKYNAVGNVEASLKIQKELDEVAIVQGYLFNCSAVFQKKVDFLASQLIETWRTLIEAAG